jgi:hypothetical protein
MGQAPVELQNLVVGSHRLYVQCGAVRSLVHTVDVSANARATVRIDVQIDAALSTEPLPLLRYESAAQVHERLTRHLTAIGRAYGARRVVGVLAHEDLVSVVDVATGSEVGQTPLTDGSRLRLLVGQAAPVANERPEPARPVATVPPVPPQAAAPFVAIVPARHERRAPVGAIVLGVLGVGFGVVGVVAHADGQNALHRQRQRGSDPADTAADWRADQNEQDLMHWVEIGGYAVGGIALVAAVLLGVFGGDSAGTPARVRASVTPLPSGGLLTLEGSL